MMLVVLIVIFSMVTATMGPVSTRLANFFAKSSVCIFGMIALRATFLCPSVFDGELGGRVTEK